MVATPGIVNLNGNNNRLFSNLWKLNKWRAACNLLWARGKFHSRRWCDKKASRAAERIETMTRHGFGFALVTAALATLGVTGCATKNYVRNQTAPLVQHTGQLDSETAENNRQIHNVDESAQAGIGKAQGAADAANQNAQSAGKQAQDADSAANDVAQRADTLDSVVKGLDNYKQMANAAVTFGFDKSMLTQDDKEQLDSFAAQLGTARNYILEVTGGTDSTGPAQYNYDLSQRRADAVVQYLVTKYNIPARRFYLIGIGKDKEVALNDTAEGRKQNRRVQVELLSNMTDSSTQTANAQ
jgi:outer membrane protein OmpA-like peptidoglycan-associated protein